MGFTHRTAATAATLLAVVIPSAAFAQITIRGILVDDSTGAPVRGAAIMLVDPVTDGPVARVLSDSGGQFSLRASAGTYQIAAVKEGFSTTLSAPVPLDDGEGLTIRVPIASKGEVQHRIGVLEHTLGRSQRSSRPNGTSMVPGLQTRHATGSGLAFTRKDLASWPGRTVADFLGSLPGVALSPSSASRSTSGPAISMRGNVSDNCHVGWFVDGHRMDLPGMPDPFTEGLSSMSLDDLEAIEVFRGLSEMPAEFASPELRCGAVALWTKRG